MSVDQPRAPWELPEQGDTLLIIEMSPQDGVPRVVTDPFRADSIAPTGRDVIRVEPPLTFATHDAAQQWLDENAAAGWKYLVCKAVKDAEGAVPADQAFYRRQTARLHAIMEKGGFQLHGSGSYEEGEYRRSSDGKVLTVAELLKKSMNDVLTAAST